MGTKGFAVLAAATGAVVLAGVAVQMGGNGSAGSGELPASIVPGAAGRVNEIASIEVVRAGETVLVSRRDGRWVVESSGGYPAKPDTVKQAVLGLTELAPRERKTSDPDRYGRLGLDDPSSDNEAVGVTLRDAAGNRIEGVVLGNELGSGATPQRYARSVDNPQAYLVEGRVEVPADPSRWMETQILSIARDRMASVTIEHPDGEVFSLERAAEGSGFVLREVPEGREPAASGQLGAPAGSIAFLRFEDVSPRAEASIPETPTVTRFVTTNGLAITARSWVVDDETWAVFDAEGEAAAPEASDQPDESDESTDSADEEPDAAEEAAELNERLSPWAFAIPQFQADSMRRRLEALTTAVESEAGDAPDPASSEPVSAPMLDAVDDDGAGG